jgi:hypothetical protein
MFYRELSASDSSFLELPISRYIGPRKMRCRTLATVRSKHKAASTGSSSSGHPNMSRSQTWYRVMPEIQF